MEQSSGSNNVGFIKGDINNHVDVDCRVQIREGDEESVISCVKKNEMDPLFYYEV